MKNSNSKIRNEQNRVIENTDRVLKINGDAFKYKIQVLALIFQQKSMKGKENQMFRL